MKKRVTPWLLLTLLAALPAGSGSATPRFSLRTGYPCQACHVDPSGGGMRKALGSQYGDDELPVPGWAGGSEESLVPRQVGNWLGIGADFRTMYFAVRQETLYTHRTTRNDAFFQMQGDIYLNLSISHKVSLLVRKGIWTDFDAFALVSALPLGGTVKVGHFVPNYGTRLDDHTAFIRSMTGFSPERTTIQHTGAEVALSPFGVRLTGGIYNAQDGFGSGTSNAKAFLGRADVLLEIAEGFHWSAGANVYRTQNGDGSTMTLMGGMTSLDYRGLTLLGEVDRITTKGAGESPRQSVGFIEADYPVVAGVDVKVSYDFFDPDDARLTGVTWRYTAGLEFFPVTGVEVRPLYRFGEETGNGIQTRQCELHLHVYF